MFKYAWLTLVATWMWVSVNAVTPINDSSVYETQIIEQLLSQSSNLKKSRPLSSMTLLLTVFLNQINSIDDTNQLMTSSTYIMAEWMDPRLQWDPSKFNMLEIIIISASDIWLPDLCVLNSASPNLFLNLDPKTLALVDSDGHVSLLYSAASLVTRCRMDVSRFPFDTQTCSIDISSWTVGRDYLQLSLANLVAHSYVENPVWRLNDVTTNLVARFERSINMFDYYIDTLYINLNIKRRPLYYMINLIFPCLMLNLLTLVCFALPAASQFNISVTIFLTFSIYSVRISSQIPIQSTNMPLVTWYFVVSMVFTLIAFCWFIIDHWLRNVNYMPRWLTRFSSLISKLDLIKIKNNRAQQESELNKNMLALNRFMFCLIFSAMFAFNTSLWIFISL